MGRVLACLIASNWMTRSPTVADCIFLKHVPSTVSTYGEEFVGCISRWAASCRAKCRFYWLHLLNISALLLQGYKTKHYFVIDVLQNWYHHPIALKLPTGRLDLWFMKWNGILLKYCYKHTQKNMPHFFEHSPLFNST